MDGSIAQLQSHYRLVGARTTTSGAAVRLDSILHERLIASYDRALDQVFGGDDSVYCIRRVNTKLMLMLTQELTDDSIAKSWGEQMATAVVRAITTESDPSNVVRFENHASYLANYVVALLKGEAANQWFFASFGELSALDPRRAVNRLLVENRDHLPRVLACVQKLGELDALISVLDLETKAALWSREAIPDREAIQPFFINAYEIVEAIDGWSQSRPPREELFLQYLNTAPALPDWSDRRSLAESILKVLRFFFTRGYLTRRPSDAFRSRLAAAVMELDWLDGEWLASSFLELMTRDDRAPVDLPLARIINRATPRQRELLSTIAEAIAEAQFKVDRDPLTEAVRLFALVAARAPKWTEDAAARAMILKLLVVHAARHDSDSPSRFSERVRAHDAEGALSLLPGIACEETKDAIRFVARLGEPALEVIEQLGGTVVVERVAIESECAGLALLLRTMLDVRVPFLCDDTRFPQKDDTPRFAVLFLSTVVKLIGERAVIQGRLDRALCLLVGLDEPVALDSLRDCWKESDGGSAFRGALLEIAAGQRLLEPEEFHHELSDHGPSLGNSDLDSTLTEFGCILLKLWARWLRRFSDSSIPYLLENFLDRPGRIFQDSNGLVVELQRRPLDVIVEMAGYLNDLERVPWLRGGRIKFRLRGA